MILIVGLGLAAVLRVVIPLGAVRSPDWLIVILTSAACLAVAGLLLYFWIVVLELFIRLGPLSPYDMAAYYAAGGGGVVPPVPPHTAAPGPVGYNQYGQPYPTAMAAYPPMVYQQQQHMAAIQPPYQMQMLTHMKE